MNTKEDLRAQLSAAREYTLAIYAHLTPAQLQVPLLAIVNPPPWELAHIAWFQEFWCCRERPGRPPRPSRYEHFDAWYNSSVIPHAARWALPHPAYDEILRQMGETFDATLHALERADSGALYPFALSVLHERMHAEALLMTLQTLALPMPPLLEGAAPDESIHVGARAAGRDIAFTGGTYLMGTPPDGSRFVFDNEKWAYPAAVAPFSIASHCVSNAEYAQFVADNGYARREWWSEAGWAWRVAAQALHPATWRQDGTQWLERRYDRWRPPVAAQPALHVNLHEAQAYCAWAKRRLPSEAEWEFAARAGGGPANFPWGDEPALLRDCALEARSCGPLAVGPGESRFGPLAHMLGNVWEWTATPFAPYPGFAADPYADYSEPWFGNHAVLRGGSFVTAACLIHNRFRNFYLPERGDMFVGFRTCALD